MGAIDLFVEEDMDYARRLIASGVRTELHVVPGAFHGFDIFGAQTSIAKQFTAPKMAALKGRLRAGLSGRGRVKLSAALRD